MYRLQDGSVVAIVDGRSIRYLNSSIAPHDTFPDVQPLVFLVGLTFIATISFRNAMFHKFFNQVDFKRSSKLKWLKLFMDMLIIFIPVIASITALSNFADLVVLNVLLFVPVILILAMEAFAHKRFHYCVTLKELLMKETSPAHGTTMGFTYLKGIVLILIGAAILACDLVQSGFPAFFEKTITYGHTLMDVGIGACMICYGIGRRMNKALATQWRPKSKSRLAQVQRSNWILPLLGLIRTFIHPLLGFYSSVEEYGRDWNFFFTLSVVVIFARKVPNKYPFSMAVFWIVFTGVFHYVGVESYVMFLPNYRSNIIDANIEGIASIPGNIALYCVGFTVADFVARTAMVRNTIGSWLKCSFSLLGFGVVFLILQHFAEACISPASRCIANVAYCFAQLGLIICGWGGTMIIQTLTMAFWYAGTPSMAKTTHPFSAVQPCLLEMLNNQGLWFFMLCNLWTGVVNKATSPKQVPALEAWTILLLYLIVSSAMSLQLEFRQKRKISPEIKHL